MKIVFSFLAMIILNLCLGFHIYGQEPANETPGGLPVETSLESPVVAIGETLIEPDPEPAVEPGDESTADALIEYTVETDIESVIDSQEEPAAESPVDATGKTLIELYENAAQEADVKPSRDNKYLKLKRSMLRKIGQAGVMHAKLLVYREKAFGLNSIETLVPIEALAWIYMEQKYYRDAEILFKRAIKIRKEKVARSRENIKKLGINYFMLGDTFLYREQYYRAEESFDLSMSYARDSGHKGDVLSRKGIVYEGLDDPEKAAGYYLEAVREYRAEKNKNPKIKKHLNKRLIYAYYALIRIYEEAEDQEKVDKYQDLLDELKREEVA